MKRAILAKQPRKSSLAAETELTKPRFQGWLSTDEEEIERRRYRGAEEAMDIEPEEPGQPFFGTFLTHSESGGSYHVEIRSLNELRNSCDCPDFVVNRLGTCKHVEAVLHHLRRSGQDRFQQAAEQGDERAEIYVDRRDGRIHAAWPPGEHPDDPVRRLLEPFLPATASCWRTR